MNCKEIQEFIIIDYIDGQMGDKQKSIIEQHLSQCHACNVYLSSIKKEAVNPFINASKDVPDQLLWAKIKQSIEEEQQQQLETSLKPNFWERFKSAVLIPRPAFVLTTLVTMVFIFGSTGQLFFSSPKVNISGQDQVEYISTLMDESGSLNDGNDPQTPIEKYFL